MDVLLWLIVVIAAVVLVVSGLVATGRAPAGMLPSRLPELRLPAARPRPARTSALISTPPVATGGSAVVTPVAARASEDRPRSGTLDEDVVRRLESKIELLAREMNDRFDALRTAFSVAQRNDAELIAGLQTQLQLRDEVLRTMIQDELRARPQMSAPSRLAERRVETTADLYGRVARLEAALAQASFPVLLPGEAYAPPDDLSDDMLVWENWKDVGDRAFDLADAFNAQRLQLSDETRSVLTAFVTLLRGQLTRAIYPNLGPDLTSTQREELRGSLAVLAVELPKVRRALDLEYREAYSQPE